MYADLIIKHIIEESGKYVDTMEKFKESLPSIFPSYSEDNIEEHFCIYRKAIRAMESWVKMILSAEVMLFRKTTVASCKLLLPEGEYLYQAVSYEQIGGCDTSDRNDEENLLTPIGEFSAFMYRAITEIPDNPVKLFYEHIYTSIDSVYGMDLTLDFGKNPFYFTPAYAKSQGIKDDIGIYSFSIMAEPIHKFLNPNYPMLGKSLYHFKNWSKKEEKQDTPKKESPTKG